MLELPQLQRNGARWDVVALGEVMLRLDPGDGRIATTRTFRVWEGGGEYNVARGLRKCFGLRTAVVTGLADNPVGRLIEDLVHQGGVDTSHVVWRPYDGVGRSVRNGLNFTERGFGVRGAVGCSDRGHTAASQLRPGEIDWSAILELEGSRWFHTGGIFAGLSDTTAAVAEEAMRAARAAGVVVSYDLNYRPSLWAGVGGAEQARKVNRALVSLADVLFGNEEDLSIALGYELTGVDDDYTNLDPSDYAAVFEQAVEDYPNLAIVATSLRSVRSASVNSWSGLCFVAGRLIEAQSRSELEIFDRVGGGDSFASGLIYGLLSGLEIEEALELGVAHGALAMTTPGDNSMATLEEVKRLAAGGNARVHR
ncbi:MAG: 2-dehydro-3-deoxygluconokinase [Gaiellaceae bacterium]|jgi:2-dehydro-3-deoxygluconokinase|nr:2-dehydro-3-deoxygluconokinase [Gaiellaceae bacterium]